MKRPLFEMYVLVIFVVAIARGALALSNAMTRYHVGTARDRAGTCQKRC